MWIFESLKIIIITLFIFIRHCINPFKPVVENVENMTEKLTWKEKQWLISKCKSGMYKSYLQERFYFMNGQE